MPIINMEMNLENLYKSRQSILEGLANPYCDVFMHLGLTERLKKVDAKIEELEANI